MTVPFPARPRPTSQRCLPFAPPRQPRRPAPDRDRAPVDRGVAARGCPGSAPAHRRPGDHRGGRFPAGPFTVRDAEQLIRSGARGQDRFLGAWTRPAGAPESGKGTYPGPGRADLVGVVGTHLRGPGAIEIGYWIRRSGARARLRLRGGLGDHRASRPALPGADHRGGMPPRQRRLLGAAAEARLPRHRGGGASSRPTPASEGLSGTGRDHAGPAGSLPAGAVNSRPAPPRRAPPRRAFADASSCGRRP